MEELVSKDGCVKGDNEKQRYPRAKNGRLAIHDLLDNYFIKSMNSLTFR